MPASQEQVKWQRFIGEFGPVQCLALRTLMSLHWRNIPVPKIQLSTRNGLLVRVGTTDSAVYQQVLLDAEYGFVAGLKGIRIIVDGGANVGYTSVFLARAYPQASIIAIEPDAGNANLCRRNTAVFGNRVRVLEGALWVSHGRKISMRDNGTGAWGYQTEESETGSIQAFTMSNILEMAGGQIDLLKLDIEGAERLLFSTGTEWLHSVRNLVIELHGPECQKAVESALQGFRYTRQENAELTAFLGIGVS